MKQAQNIWQRIKSTPLAYTLVKIAGILLAGAIAAHVGSRLITRHGAHRAVPDFSGVRFDEAERLADKHGLELQINDSLFVPTYEGGIVLDQLPEAGVEVKPGRTIYVTINSFRQKMVPIPYVARRSLRQAKNMLEIAGLEIAELIYRPDMATNYVLEEYFEGRPITQGSKVEAEIGSGVTLYVGVEGGYGTAVVPQLTGSALREAKSRIWEQGLNVGKVSFDEGVNLLNQKDARVYIQSPGAERGVQFGTRIDLTLTLDQKKVADNRTQAEKQAKSAAEQRRAEEQARADSLAEAGIAPTDEAGGQTDDNTGFFD